MCVTQLKREASATEESKYWVVVRSARVLLRGSPLLPIYPAGKRSLCELRRRWRHVIASGVASSRSASGSIRLQRSHASQ